MTISMYQASVPVFVRMLGNLATILEKAERDAAERRIDPAVLVASRLFPDMYPLSQQVQIAADAAKKAVGYLAGTEPPFWEDTEKTLGELAARCRRTIDYLGTFRPEQIDGSEERTVTWRTSHGERSMPGLAYLLNRQVPNFYFHVTTAYDILRHNGVDIGKRDYLGPN